ncbi:DNA polymerase III subunit delta [bacterium DOLZORAL124_38_8]|nr:MAG: DNA polymerase III subunit delta [bacterium DOLZORAL124_38_8]
MIQNLVLLTGTDTFRLKERINFFRTKFAEKHPDGEIIFFDDSTEFPDLENAVLTPNLFGGKRLIFCENFWNTDKFQKAEKVQFFEHLPNNADTVTLIVSEPKLDKRLKGSKFLLKNAKTETFEPLPEYELGQWIQKTAKQHDAFISNANAQFLLNRVGPDLWNLSQEIQKLATANNGEITKESIETQTIANPQSQIWGFTEALSQKNTALALHRFHELLQSGQSPHEIFPMLLRETRIHAQIRDGIDRQLTSQQIAIETKLHPFVVKKTHKLTQKFSADQIKTMYDELFAIDKKLKTGGIYSFQGDYTEFELLIETFIINTCQT